MRCLLNRTSLTTLLSVAFGLAPLPAAWRDATTGQPPVEIVSAKTMGSNGRETQIAQDELGRLFFGTDKLLMFDGQTWLSYQTPHDAPITAFALGKTGRVWIGANNELGYFQEISTNKFHYHSLTHLLPQNEKDIGTIWGCATVGETAYFISRNKIFQWNGEKLRTIPMATQTRLSPLKMMSELWVHHLETGLYHLTEEGPQLEIPAERLPSILVIGLYRDEKGLVTVSNKGLIRPGPERDTPFSGPELNQHLGQYRVSAFAELPDGNLAIGTLSGGLALATRTGELIHTWDSRQGLPGRGIVGLTVDPAGNILGTTSSDFFHFPSNGIATVYNANNGLAGLTINDLLAWDARLYATTEDGTFLLNSDTGTTSAFAPTINLSERYTHMLPYHEGMLLSRFGGVDFFDGHTLKPISRTPANWTTFLIPSKNSPNRLYAAEATGVASLTEEPGGEWVRERLVDLPDEPSSITETISGSLLIGTATRGAFLFELPSRRLSAIIDPTTGQAFTGSGRIVASKSRTLLFVNGRVFQMNPGDQALQLIKGIPSFTPQLVQLTPNGTDFLVTALRTRGSEAQAFGIGTLRFSPNGDAQWQEFDIPEATLIGTIRTGTFTEENAHPILWLGGTNGILRLDYNRISTLRPPLAPTIRLANSAPNSASAESPTFHFKNHRVELAIFTGDYVASKNVQIQTRLGNADWSTLSNRRSFEFTNLSEGSYQFDARIVNTANMLSETASFKFTILPPWYRSGQAYVSYVGTLLLALLGFVRVRDRRIRQRNQQLEALVASRTQELVKANAAKDEFLASVSHEIRNPMNGVIGLTETFKTDRLDADSKRKFGLLRQCASHLASLLEDILDFSRVQADAVNLESKPFELRELLASITAMTASESEQRGIPIEIAVSPAVPNQLIGDPRRIRQILLNFVNNALKFSQRGQVSVTIWCKPSEPTQSEIIFAVSDEGPGISPEEQKRLFNRFERGAAAQQGRVPGTGLGLALCKALAEKMGGRIWLESELGQGSCFFFSATFHIQSTATTAPVNDEKIIRFKSALVVDDEEYNRITLSDQLAALGITAQLAADGHQALAFAERQDFDVVFLDYDLPGLNGLEVARAIRGLSNATSKAVIFATTAFSTPEKRSQCLAAGMNAFIGKPVTKERLYQALVPSRPEPAETNQAERLTKKPSDPFANLRLLANKKQIPFSEELALYLSELEIELSHLNVALSQRDASQAGHYAHLLYGRCGFIYERELESSLRAIEAAAANHQWEETHRLVQTVQTQLGDLKTRLTENAPAVPPGSNH